MDTETVDAIGRLLHTMIDVDSDADYMFLLNDKAKAVMYQDDCDEDREIYKDICKRIEKKEWHFKEVHRLLDELLSHAREAAK
tara:strand:- start:258 stop:506 length:249 start_codon:yes stop_codon:yes gene_type:complete